MRQSQKAKNNSQNGKKVIRGHNKERAFRGTESEFEAFVMKATSKKVVWGNRGYLAIDDTEDKNKTFLFGSDASINHSDENYPINYAYKA